MFKACLFGAVVTFALVAIPVVHFLTAIPSAFVGGYIAGTRAEAEAGQAMLIAVLMALILVGPIFGAMFVSFVLLFHFGITFVAVITGFLSLWIIMLGSLGAIVGGNAARKQQPAHE